MGKIFEQISYPGRHVDGKKAYKMLHILRMRELQIKCLYTYISVTKIKTLIAPNPDKVVGQQELSLVLRMKDGTATLEDGWLLLVELNIPLPHNPAITILSIYPNEVKICADTKSCTQIFTTALQQLHNCPNWGAIQMSLNW